MPAFKQRITGIALAATVCAALPLAANAEGMSVDARYGLFGWGEGFGIEFAGAVGQNAALRMRLTDTDTDNDETYSGVAYSLSYTLRTAGVIFDWRPGGGVFHLSAGLLYNDSQELKGTAAGSLDIGNNTYDATVRADVDWDRKVSPYFGLGWGNLGQRGKGLAWSVELGIAVTDDPDVTLTQTAGTSIPASDLSTEADELESDLDFMRRYPMISVGLGYSF
jgi:hypothetical protein